MGYTLSFEASVKCTKGDVGGLLRHIARDVDQENDCEVRHSNPDIDSSRTPGNWTLVSDGNGGWMECYDTGEIMDALNERLSHVKKPLRKDAVVLRPLVLQLDPEWYDEHKDAVERYGAAVAMTKWAADTFGAENLIYTALHNDETNPHLHIGFCPVTSDGRLSQKDWFSGPAQLRKMHDDFRQHMTDAGYEIEMKRKKPGKHAKRMGVEEYKDFAQLQDEAARIRREAEADAARIRERADEYAQTVQTQLREKMQREMDEERKKYQELREAHRSAQEAAKRDLMAWDTQEARNGLKSLLAASGAAVDAYTLPAATARTIDQAIRETPTMKRFMETVARNNARWASSGLTSVEGPTR